VSWHRSQVKPPQSTLPKFAAQYFDKAPMAYLVIAAITFAIALPLFAFANQVKAAKVVVLATTLIHVVLITAFGIIYFTGKHLNDAFRGLAPRRSSRHNSRRTNHHHDDLEANYNNGPTTPTTPNRLEKRRSDTRNRNRSGSPY